MPIPTELVLTVGGIALAIAGAAAYSALTGNSASVDYDDDGNDEITFDGSQDAAPYRNERIRTEPSQYNGDTDESADESDPNGETIAPPTSVQEIGENLESITGIGPTRAEDFRDGVFETAEDLWLARDVDLQEVDGIGPRAVEQIRSDIGGKYHDEDE